MTEKADRDQLQPDKGDDHIWGENLTSPEVLNESPISFGQLGFAICALIASMALFGSLVTVGPWCSCGRPCVLPVDVPNALKPICHSKQALPHGGKCDPSCQPGYNPSSTELVCFDQALNPETVQCQYDTKNPPGQDPRGFSMRFGANNQKYAETVVGCDFDEGKQVTGECFNECYGGQFSQPDNFNVWAVSGVKTPHGWKPPNLDCCRNLFNKCALVNSNITSSQFVALSDEMGVCNIGCVTLPPNEVRFAEDTTGGAPQPQKVQVDEFNTTEAIEDTTEVNTTLTDEIGEDEDGPQTTLAPAMVRMFELARISQGQNDTKNDTTTKPPVNQTAFWEQYQKDHANDPIPTAPGSKTVDSMVPTCFWGILFSPLCVFLFIVFLCSMSMFFCVCCCMMQQTLRESWPSNKHEVSQQVFDKCNLPVKGYKTHISSSGKYSIRDPLSPTSPLSPSSTAPDSEHDGIVDGTVMKSSSINLTGLRRNSVRGSSIAIEGTPPKEEAKQLNVLKDVCGVSRFDVRPEGMDRRKKAPIIDSSHKPREKETIENTVSICNFFEAEQELDCPKVHGLERKQKDDTVCMLCQYEAVRFVPYKLTLEVVEFYVCEHCKFYICTYCANENYTEYHRKGRGTKSLTEDED